MTLFREPVTPRRCLAQTGNLALRIKAHMNSSLYVHALLAAPNKDAYHLEACTYCSSGRDVLDVNKLEKQYMILVVMI